MARGNRRLPIVFSDADRDLFAETLSEACALAKFKTYAWVLMDNHYNSQGQVAVGQQKSSIC
jgi:REP element-mobilizing transposase RayT